MLADVHAILGGTFDPPHHGHLSVANAAVEQLEIDVVSLMPAGAPWQKTGEGVSDARDRLAMTRLAATENSRFVVDDREVVRDGPSYTIDTLEILGERCILILGSDTAAGIPSWHRGNEVLALADLAIVERPGYPVDVVRDVLGCEVTVLEMPMIDLSGTQIRDHVARGWSPRFLVPDAVCDYIETNRLYRRPASPIIADE